jgi:hypothetical protein
MLIITYHHLEQLSSKKAGREASNRTNKLISCSR